MKQLYTIEDIKKANALGLKGYVVNDAILPQTATSRNCMWVCSPKELYMTSASILPFWELD